MVSKKNILVLGGTQMLGRDFVETIKNNPEYDICLANRGITNSSLFSEIKSIIIDRNSYETCSQLNNRHFDIVIDFSCYNYNQYINVNKYITYNKYILISTQSVLDENTINTKNTLDPYYWYCVNKKELEEKVIENCYGTIIVRPGAVYGHNDYTNRFEYRDNDFYWKNTNKKASESYKCISLLDLTYYLVNSVLKLESPDTYKILQIP